MPEPQSQEVTQLLAAWSAGDRSALDRLLPMVEGELHRLVLIKVEPVFESRRSDSRFVELMRKVGLPAVKSFFTRGRVDCISGW